MSIRQALDTDTAYAVPAPMRSDVLQPTLRSVYGVPPGDPAFADLLQRLDRVPACG